MCDWSKSTDYKGHVVLRRRLSRRQFLTYLANLECRLIGMQK